MQLIFLMFGALCTVFAAESIAQSPKIHRENIEWLEMRVFDGDGTKLPRVLLIGDSICLGYFGRVQTALNGRASMSYMATSKALPDAAYLDEVKLMLSEYKYDVIHFNNGLHGMGYSELDYQNHFPALIALIKKMQPQAKLIWAASTPWREPAPNLETFSPNNDRVKARNLIASRYISKAGISIDDLYSLVEKHPEWYANDGLHYNDQGVTEEAEQVTKYVLAALDEK